MVSRAATETVRFVVGLDDVGTNDIAIAGGKGANLGELTRAGFPVPGGFIITTDAYRAAIDAAGLNTRIPDPSAGDGAAMRDAITQLRPPDWLVGAISDAYARLGGTVAVRSSATAEDLPGAAFAGQQDTYLGITGIDDVLEAVRACWASLWNERAIAYRRRLNIGQDGVAIAVVVQRLISADAAGVLFTADPVTGIRDHLVIDANPGLGEAVVSGMVTPDHYVIDRRGNTLDWSPGKREVIVSHGDSGGTAQTPGEASSEPLLQHSTLAGLATLGDAVAAHFTSPQDIEWAIADGKIHLVQARPMTALPVPQKLNRIQKLIGSVFSDYFSVRPYPLDMTTWVPYGPLGLMDRVVASVGIRSHFDTILPEEDGVVVQFVPPIPTPTWRTLGAVFSVLSRARRFNPARWRDDARFDEFNQSLGAISADASQLEWSELVQTARATLRLLDPITALRTSYLPAMGVAIIRLRIALARLHRLRLMADLVTGARTVTAEGNDRLAELAETVRSNAQLAELFDSDDPTAILKRIRRRSAFAEFTTDFDTYLSDFGHRETTSPVLVSSPTWADTPETVIGLISVLAADHTPRPAATRSADAEAELLTHPRLQSPDARARILKRVNAARAGIAFREDSHDAFTRVVPVLRRTLCEIGARMRDAGIIADPFDVFHLRLEELEAINAIATLSMKRRAELTDTVRARSLKREELAAVGMVDYAAIFGSAKRPANALTSGTPACAGRATGAVRVIMAPDEFGSLKPGEILVCPYTNPSWTPLFQRAAAVVVDTGGIGSHAAIVARENGIPALMGTGDGTRLLKTGQRVTVDGTTGVVTPA